MSNGLFDVGDKVRLKAEPSKIGRVVGGPRIYSTGEEYEILLRGADEAWYAASELEVVQETEHLQWGTRDEFLRSIYLAKMRAPFTDSLYSYRASRTKFEAYQFRPALKFLRNPEQRILIADEVGLGKTIEAAIIYLELKARLNISRIMVLCPSRLKQKWHDEMRYRFGEKFLDLDSKGIRQVFQDYDRIGPNLSFRVIASFETLRRAEFVEELLQRQIHLDLLIVDEAHYMRNSNTATHRLGAVLTDNADAAVFLTATPLQLGTRDLFNLLHLLSPADFDDQSMFKKQIQPNRHINQAARLMAVGDHNHAVRELCQVEHTLLRDRFIGNPHYERVRDHIPKARTTPERVELQRNLLELNTLASIFTRTRKREVSHAAVRAPYSINVELTPEERAFYNGIMSHVRTELRRKLGRGAIGFAIVTKERMAASCLAATRDAFKERYRSHSRVRMEIERSIFDLGNDDDENVHIELLGNDLLQLANQMGDQDSKFDMFERTLREALAEDVNSKALVFSTFRRTLDYLQKRLTEKGHKVDVIHGGYKVIDRQYTIERFRIDPDFRILLSSEVGAEGLDFQFCDILMNYDLPWNPMQVEQRIGRLDRFGQEHERIRIYNFYIADTIETRIFHRLYNRINIFKESIGDLEEILGEEIRSLQRSVLQKDLTPQEEAELAKQSATRIVRRQLEAEELEKQKDELLGQQQIFSQQVLDAVNSGRVIHPEEVRALVETFLLAKFPRANFVKDHEEPISVDRNG
jgi:SNF2 family DNA or RNA helicase